MPLFFSFPAHTAEERPDDRIRNLISESDALEATITAELAAQRLTAKANLKSALLAVIEKLKVARDIKRGLALQDDLDRFEKYGFAAIQSQDVLVRAPLLAYHRDVQVAERAIVEKYEPTRLRVRQALLTEQSEAQTRGDKATETVAQRALQSLIVRQAVTDPTRLAATYVAGSSENLTSDIPSRGMPLIGFRASTGGWYKEVVLYSLQPIFLSPAGPQLGEKRGGDRKEKEIVARNGYAVGAIRVRTAPSPQGLQVIFMKLRPGGLSLDPDDSYESDWIGTGGEYVRELNACGKLVVGITTSATEVIHGLGLIHLK